MCEKKHFVPSSILYIYDIHESDKEEEEAADILLRGKKRQNE